MSILAKAATTTAGLQTAGSPTAGPQTEISGPFALLLLGMIIAAPIIAWRLGVFRRGSIRGPVRLAGDAPLFGMLLTTFVGGGAWFGIQVAYVVARGAAFRAGHENQAFDLSQMSSGDFAFLSTVPFAVGLLLLWAGDSVTGVVGRIGYSPGKLISGIARGIVAMLMVLPVMWVSSIALQTLYTLVHFEHPGEHELLAAMKDAPANVRMLLVFGACVAAPVFEELLFRGHVQTILVRLFTPSPMPQPLPPLAVMAADTAHALPIPPPLDYAAPDVKAVEVAPGLRWIAIFITSLIFAGVHPMWMAPMIFILSLCLGYAYERTGNLWVNIVMHAIFNLSSTVIFLNVG